MEKFHPENQPYFNQLGFFLAVAIAPKERPTIFAPSNGSGTVIWSVRLGVRTADFHSANRGSIPLRTTPIAV
jgi:hypothetical protein